MDRSPITSESRPAGMYGRRNAMRSTTTVPWTERRTEPLDARCPENASHARMHAFSGHIAQRRYHPTRNDTAFSNLFYSVRSLHRVRCPEFTGSGLYPSRTLPVPDFTRPGLYRFRKPLPDDASCPRQTDPLRISPEGRNTPSGHCSRTRPFPSRNPPYPG